MRSDKLNTDFEIWIEIAGLSRYIGDVIEQDKYWRTIRMLQNSRSAWANWVIELVNFFIALSSAGSMNKRMTVLTFPRRHVILVAG